jgi:hypothetical protein
MRWNWLSGLTEILLALLTEVLLEKNDVAGVGAEHGICQVAKERDKSKHEIEGNVHQHLCFEGGRQTAIYAHARPHNHESEESVDCIAKTRE